MAEIIPFPLARQAGYVDRIARRIRSLSTQSERNAAMVSVVRVEFERLLDLGVAREVAEPCLISFCDSVWEAVNQEVCGFVA